MVSRPEEWALWGQGDQGLSVLAPPPPPLNCSRLLTAPPWSPDTFLRFLERATVGVATEGAVQSDGGRPPDPAAG